MITAAGQSGFLLPPDGPAVADEELLMGPHDEVEEGEPVGMDDEELEALIAYEIDEAVNIQVTLGKERQLATDYYNGADYGDEVEGRSKAKTRDVRDTVNAIMPDLMRIFFGAEHVVEFIPRGPEDEAQAEQETDYIDYVLKCDNPGFLTLYWAFQDAMVRRRGVVKWWWEESSEVTVDTYTSLSPEAANLLLEEGQSVGASVETEANPEGTYNVLVRRKAHDGRIRIEAIPPEEFLINASARSIEKSRFTAHQCTKTVGELIAMGLPEELVEEQAGISEFHDRDYEARKRIPTGHLLSSNTQDEANRPVLYTECYYNVDYDGDGIAELRQICTIGENHKVVRNSPASERPFADFCPCPEAHTTFGKGLADLVMDIQRLKSTVMRRILDSLSQSIDPRTAVVEGQVNIEDVLNNETGGIIRMRAPGMVQPFILPFVGQQALPVMELLDSTKQDRTGISKAAAGLDADALQSTTKAAVAATVSAANRHVEMIARILAETGMKSLMRGLRRLSVRHQDKQRTVRLRNKWVQVSPASWSADADVQVNVAMGSGSREERLAGLERIAQRQEAVLQNYGPGNPLVSLAQYRRTLGKILELSGFRNPGLYFNDVPDDYQPPPQQPGQTPEQQSAMLLAQVQAKQIEADIEMKKADLALKREEMLLRDDRERDKNEADVILRARELEMRYSQAVDIAQIQANTDRHRIQTEAVSAQQPPAAPVGQEG